MAWPYEYTPYIWSILASGAYLAVLAIYGIRHRIAPGAVPFTILTVGAIPWVLANGLGLASTDDTTKIFWFKFETALLLPLVSTGLCFALDYAGLGKWLTRRMLALLAIVPLAYALLIFTNETHHLVWTRIWIDGNVRGSLEPVQLGAIAYGYFLGLLHLMVLAWLFARSPRHRWIAGGLIFALLIMRSGFLIDLANWNPVAPIDPMVFVLSFALLLYALALFRFHMFEVVPVARDMVIERMADGMVVLDAENRIADINGKAKTLLGTFGSKVIGSHIAQVIHPYPDLLRLIGDSGEAQCEVSFGDTYPRWYQASISPLIDWRGFQLGRLIWFHDITEQKRARGELLDRQRTLAVLGERQLLARELHDGIGQMLAAVQLQVKSASELLARGETALLQSCLHRLAEINQETKESVREYLVGVKSRFSPEQSLFTALRQYLNHYNHNYGIHTELVVPPELEERRIGATVEAQLQPIIQEALTNIRRHSGASSARVIFSLCGSEVQVTVEDDGRGFGYEKIEETQGFGMQAMQGRADMIGGRFVVSSAPGKGTQVTIQVPLRKEA
jgi:PAS domain S-box-containing protein